MYKVKRVRKYDIRKLNKVASILNACGKDMAERYDIHHWDNPYLKSFIIVCLCALKSDIYLLYDNGKPAATFMTKQQNEILHFEKFATIPSESGKGIGSFCLKKIEKIAESRGCEKVALEVYQLSQHAISFYQHNGYRIVGTTDTLKYKEVKMEKSI